MIAGIGFDRGVQPILVLIVNSYTYTQSSLQARFTVATVQFTPSRYLDVRQDWHPMYYSKEMKAQMSYLQLNEPIRISAPTRDLNQGPSSPQPSLMTTILRCTRLPMHTWWWRWCTERMSTCNTWFHFALVYLWTLPILENVTLLNLLLMSFLVNKALRCIH